MILNNGCHSSYQPPPPSDILFASPQNKCIYEVVIAQYCYYSLLQVAPHTSRKDKILNLKFSSMTCACLGNAGDNIHCEMFGFLRGKRNLYTEYRVIQSSCAPSSEKLARAWALSFEKKTHFKNIHTREVLIILIFYRSNVMPCDTEDEEYLPCILI